MEKKITECFISGPFPIKITILSFTHLTKYQFVNYTNLWYSILQACHYLLERKWQPTPVFLPRESHGQRSLVGCCP